MIDSRFPIRASSTRAGPSGRRPCSQFLRVPSGTPMLSANAGCYNPATTSRSASLWRTETQHALSHVYPVPDERYTRLGILGHHRDNSTRSASNRTPLGPQDTPVSRPFADSIRNGSIGVNGESCSTTHEPEGGNPTRDEPKVYGRVRADKVVRVFRKSAHDMNGRRSLLQANTHLGIDSWRVPGRDHWPRTPIPARNRQRAVS